MFYGAVGKVGLRASVAPFTPAALFAAGEQGFWYEPSDLSRYTATSGSDLVTNGNFSDGTTGWTAVSTTMSVTGGVFRITNTGAVAGYASTNFSTTIGSWYKITVNCIGGTSTNSVRVGTSANSLANINASPSNGLYSAFFRATATNTYVTLRNGTATSALYTEWDNVSVMEVPAYETATMFQDVFGSTAVSLVEQPVAAIFDQSKGLALGPELVANGDFSDGSTGWTASTGWTISSGLASVVAPGTFTDLLYQATSFTVGATYVVTFTISNYVSGSLTPRFVGGTTNSSANASSNGTYKRFITAVTGNNQLSLRASNNGEFSVDNISVKLLSGNHAFQTTDASRPVLSARYNLALNTENFAAANWTVSRSVASLAGINPPSIAQTAWKLEDNGSTVNTSRIFSTANITTVTGLSYKLSFYLKGGTLTEAFLRRPGSASDANGVYFNTSTGTTTNAGTVTSSSMTSVGDGWWLCEAVMTAATTTGLFYIGLALGGTTTFQLTTGTQYVYISAPDIRVANDGVGIPSYQRVGAAVSGTSTTAGTGDYDTVGFPLYLAFDGTDDGLSTSSIDFSSTDKVSLFTGSRKLVDTAGVIVELSTTVASNPGSFALTAARTSTDNFAYTSAGSLFTSVNTASGYAAPFTAVVTGLSVIGTDTNILRVNGSSTTAVQDQGTDSYGNYPLYIGRRGGSSLAYNGRLYSLIGLGRTATSAEITNTESWVNGYTKAY